MSDSSDPSKNTNLVFDPDLTKVFDDVNKKYFQGSRKLAIYWCLDLPFYVWGQYDIAEKAILINVTVKKRDSWVPGPPENFLEYLIFHEILHDVYPRVIKFVKKRNGGLTRRHCDHTPEFKKHEKTFPNFKNISDWENIYCSMHVGSKFLKFGTPQYREQFNKVANIPDSHYAYMAYFQLKDDLLKDKWSVLGIDPVKRKTPLQAIRLTGSTQVKWFHPADCKWS